MKIRDLLKILSLTLSPVL
jgi:importin subunit beta-1